MDINEEKKDLEEAPETPDIPDTDAAEETAEPAEAAEPVTEPEEAETARDNAEETPENTEEVTREAQPEEVPEEEDGTDEDEPEEEPEEPVLSFQYNVTNEEEEQAFLLFQKKYVYKHNWRVTAAFGAVALIFIISIIRKPTGYLNWILTFISLFMIFTTWFNTVRIRKYLVSALKALEDDKYRFTLYDDRFIIETVFTEAEMAEEDFVPVKPREVKFRDIDLNIVENSDMFIIILKKETIYVLSKRVLTQEQQRVLRNTFSETLGEDFENMTQTAE